MSFDAVVLAGGQGRRLGGRDKAELVVARGRLLDVVLAACAGARRTVVVGPQRSTATTVTWAREDPPGGGPCAAIAAALPHVTAPTCVLLAVDLPSVTRTLVERLAAAAPVVGIDDGGREQWLLSAWPTVVLRDLPAEGSLRHAFGGLAFTVLPVGRAARDVDTDDDLAQAATAADDSTSTTPSETRTG
jgi:molybdopterin-guanine dinucleotide biosynthesis protein A